MQTKTWKIGEYAKGGIITVQITGKVVIVIGKEWDFSAGSTRSSNQDNAKEFTRGTADTTDPSFLNKLDNFLNDLTSCYWTGKITDWIKSKLIKNK